MSVIYAMLGTAKSLCHFVTTNTVSDNYYSLVASETRRKKRVFFI